MQSRSTIRTLDPGVRFWGEEVAEGSLLHILLRDNTLWPPPGFPLESEDSFKPLSTQARRQAQSTRAGPGHLTPRRQALGGRVAGKVSTWANPHCTEVLASS